MTRFALPSSVSRTSDAAPRRWRGLRRMGQGIAGLLMLMPVLARGAGMDGFRAVSELDGVSGVDVMGDGALRLRMENGATLSVPAGDVRIAENGEIFVSDRIVALAGDVAQAAAAGGGGGGSGAIAGLGALGGLGGGGGGGGGGGAAPAPDVPRINIADATTDGGIASARITAPLPEEADTLRVILTDVGGGTTEQTVTVAPDGSWTYPAGAAALPQGLVGITLEPFDDAGGPLDPLTAQLRIDTIAPEVAITNTGTGADGVLNTAEAQAGIVVQGTTDAEDGQVVTLALDGVDYTTSVAGGLWQVALPAVALTALGDGAAALSATVTDAAGNISGAATAGFTVDVTAPVIAADTVSGDGKITLQDLQGGLVLTGTTDAEDGQVVTVTFGGTQYTGTVAAGAGGSTWAVTVPQAALAALRTAAGDAPAAQAFTVSVSDAAGNVASPVTVPFDTDFTAPSISIDPVSGDGLVSAAEAATGITVSGQTANVPEGQTVTVQAGVLTFSALTGADGAWQVTLTPAEVAALGDGSTVTVLADVTNGDGIAASQATAGFTTDVTAPQVAITDTGTGADGVLNAAEAQAGIVVQGTTDAEDGQVVTLTLDRVDYTASVAGGLWQVAVPVAALTALGDGAAALSATVTDAAGNTSGEATAGFTVDVTAPQVAITDTGTGADGVLNAAEAQAGIVVQGTTDAEDGQGMTLTLDGVDYTASVAGGVWQVTVPAAALTALADGGNMTLTAGVSDAAGNAAAPVTASFATDFTAPDITLPDLADGTTLDLGARDALTGIAVATTAADGAAVTLSLRRPDGTEDMRVETVVSGGGSFTIPLDAGQVAALQDLTGYTLSVTLADAAGNPASLSQTLVTDFSPLLEITTAGQDGVFDLTDPGGASVSGTTAGVEAGQQVTVTLSTQAGGPFHSATATVAADGGWSLALSQAVLTQVAAGTQIAISADVDTLAGRSATTASGAADAWQAALYRFEAAGPVDGTVTLTASGTGELSVAGGLAIDTSLSFDPAQATFTGASAQAVLPGLFLITNEAGAAGGDVSFGGIVANAFALPAPLYDFDVTLTGAGPVRFDFTDAEQGGPAALIHGTAGADTMGTGAVDSTLRGAGGDDTLVLGSGAHRVTFETDATANGHDTVTGFTTGSGALADQISLTGAVDLRGAGTGVEALAQGGALGADTGFVVFTTALADTSAASVESGFTSLLVPAPSETVFVLAGDGTDAVLARIDTGGDGVASAQIMADFDGIGDLAAFDPAAVILPDPALQAV